MSPTAGADEIVDNLRVIATQLAESGLGSLEEGTEVARRVVLLKEVQDRLSAVIKEAVAGLGEAGLSKVDVDGVPYRIRQSVTYRWNLDELFPRLREVAREYGVPEIDVVRTACSISTAKVKGLREFSIDPDEYRQAQPGSWRIEGPREAKEAKPED